jgi:GntR family transcriptional regulator
MGGVETGEAAGEGLGFRPLYAQVKDRFLARMVSGEWAPGMLLPSEPQLAAEIGVSPGTVRKALNALHDENLIVRRQGRGTYVAEHTAQRALFHFFKLVGPDGGRALPDTVWSDLTAEPATEAVAERLGLAAGAPVWRLRRHRALDGAVLVSEAIHLAAADFPDLDRRRPLPNNVYSLYEKAYGRVVARAVEDLSAVAAAAEDAAALGCAEGAPVLLIDRTAYGLDGRPVELRRSVCRTGRHRYRCDLR